MIEIEGKINDQPIAILIDLGASHSYIASNLVERFKLKKRKHGKSWLVQLATRTKRRRINEIVKGCPLDMNGLHTFVDLNIISLGSYDVLTGMDCLDAHHVILDFHNKILTSFDEEGSNKIVNGIPRPISVR